LTSAKAPHRLKMFYSYTLSLIDHVLHDSLNKIMTNSKHKSLVESSKSKTD
ncbi:hypothetical protein L9F63_001530, partial [Diploptera punctata]